MVSSDEVVRVEEHRVEEHRASDVDSIVGSHSSVSSRHSTGSLSAVTAAFGKSGASTTSSSRKSSHSGEYTIYIASVVCRLRIIKTRTERGRPGTEATIYI